MFEISQKQSLYLKGIAIMLVVVGHLGLVYRGGAIGVHIFCS